uniref:Uncharacterized protein n=1 Tax=Pseudomonas marincola TaxID=437900 RepID=A0A653EAJ7_9PSED
MILFGKFDDQQGHPGWCPDYLRDPWWFDPNLETGLGGPAVSTPVVSPYRG